MVVKGKGSICRVTSSMQKNVAASWRIVVVGTGLALANPSTSKVVQGLKEFHIKTQK
jgi:uncharacterized membrane protein